MSDVILDVVVLDDDDQQYTAVRLSIPHGEVDQFVSDFEEHFISQYNEAEIL